MPLPPVYRACPGGDVASKRRGSPSTTTARVNATVMLTAVPAARTPSASGEVTLVAYAVVADVSIVMPPGATSEPFAPGAGSVRLAEFPAMSVSMPPPVDRASRPA